MKAERAPAAAGPLVQGFAGRAFRIDGVSYEGALLTPGAVTSWAPPAPGALAAADIAPLLALRPAPEFILLGTGSTLVFPPRAFIAALEEAGVGIEAMDSRTAARTWGLLRGEGRWIAAALMPL